MKNKVTEAPRIWQLTRWCCTSGQCVDCHLASPSETAMYKSPGRAVRRRIIHADKLTEETAKRMEKNWSGYDAKACLMPLSEASQKAIEDYRAGKLHWSQLTVVQKAVVVAEKSDAE